MREPLTHGGHRLAEIAPESIARMRRSLCQKRRSASAGRRPIGAGRARRCEPARAGQAQRQTAAARLPRSYCEQPVSAHQLGKEYLVRRFGCGAGLGPPRLWRSAQPQSWHVFPGTLSGHEYSRSLIRCGRDSLTSKVPHSA